MRELRIAHLEQRPMPLRERRADVPAALSNLVDRLLAKDAAARPATAAEVASELELFTQKSEIRQRRPTPTWLWVLGFLALSLLFGGIIYVATDLGTVVIKTDDPDVEVAVKQNGRVIVIFDKKSGNEFTIRSGTYELELQKGKDGLKLSTDRLVLKRGDKKIVEVTLERPKGWVAKAPLRFPTSSAMVGVIGGRIYVVGGFTGQASLPSVQIYDPLKDEWSEGTPMQRTDDGDVGRYNGSALVFDNRLHVLGGWRHFKDTAQKRHALPTTTYWIYDPTKDRKSADNPSAWSQGKPLPILSGASISGVIAGRFYVLTGADGNAGYHKHFHVFDDRKEWAKLDAPPNAHVGGAGAVIDGKFYVVGGQTRDGLVGKVYEDLHVYDPVAKKWFTRRPMPKARTNLNAVAVGNKLYVIGGADVNGKTLDTVEAYDPATDSWTSLPPLGKPRQSHVLTVIGRTIYAIGGTDGARLFGTVEALDLAAIAPAAK